MGGRAVAMMLSLVKERELHPYSIRQDAMSLLSKLCHNCPDNAAVVGDLDGVPVLIQVRFCSRALCFVSAREMHTGVGYARARGNYVRAVDMLLGETPRSAQQTLDRLNLR
eukprot:896509-Rhodomonas_salina.2